MSEAEFEAKIIEAAKAMHADFHKPKPWDQEYDCIKQACIDSARVAAKVYGLATPVPAETPGERFAKGLFTESPEFCDVLRVGGKAFTYTHGRAKDLLGLMIDETAAAFDADRARLADEVVRELVADFNLWNPSPCKFLDGLSDRLRALIAPAKPAAGGAQ